MSRYGFLWRAHYETATAAPPYSAGYYKFVRAWTPWGARRLAAAYRHAGWTVAVERAVLVGSREEDK